MDAYTHVEINAQPIPHVLDDLDHGDAQLYHLTCLFAGTLTIVFVQEAHHHVAVTNRVDFEQRKSITLLVEVCEEVGEHCHYLSRAVLVAVLGEALDISVEESHVFVDVAHVQLAGIY